MRLLEFQVNRQSLRKLPGCDFSNIVAGSSGYLRAKFHFSEDWDEYVKKAVEFVSEHGDNKVVLLDENNECNIPLETGGFFMVTVYGAGKLDDDQLPVVSTNSMKVKQKVGINNVEH